MPAKKERCVESNKRETLKIKRMKWNCMDYIVCFSFCRIEFLWLFARQITIKNNNTIFVCDRMNLVLMADNRIINIDMLSLAYWVYSPTLFMLFGYHELGHLVIHSPQTYIILNEKSKRKKKKKNAAPSEHWITPFPYNIKHQMTIVHQPSTTYILYEFHKSDRHRDLHFFCKQFETHTILNWSHLR